SLGRCRDGVISFWRQSFICVSRTIMLLILRHSMKTKMLVIGSLATLSLVPMVCGQTLEPRAVITHYCSTCHSDKAKASGMDSARKSDFDTLDVTHVSRDAETWERIVRKLRAGMMPPSGMRRPDPVMYKGLITWLENELDRNAATYTPPPGLHRLNR